MRKDNKCKMCSFVFVERREKTGKALYLFRIKEKVIH